jgi:hypothetical protein
MAPIEGEGTSIIGSGWPRRIDDAAPPAGAVKSGWALLGSSVC